MINKFYIIKILSKSVYINEAVSPLSVIRHGKNHGGDKS